MTVEFALVLPILMALLFGMIDLGRFIATRVMLSQAASAGARAACLGSTTTQTQIDTAVSSAATMLSGINVTNYTCVGSATQCTFPLGAGAIVSFRVNYSFTTGYFSAFRRNLWNTGRVVC
jgi:Flp pilus assembly protein TadG